MSALTLAVVIGSLVFIGLIAVVLVASRVQATHSVKRANVVKKEGPAAPLLHAETNETVKPRKGVIPQTGRETGGGRRMFLFGGAIGAVFGVLAAKLWSLQLLNRSYYESLAEQNFTASVSTVAPRGRILDRNGVELVRNRASLTLLGSSELADDRNLVHRLSLLTGIPKTALRRRLLDESGGAQADRIIASDVSLRAISYLSEHPTLFSGVSVESRTVREYPFGSIAAHVLGYTGTISESELAANDSSIDYQSDDVVGKSGVEAAYESVLQGIRGTKTYKVDSSGSREALLGEVPSQSGDDVVITIDAEAQKAAEWALSEAFASCARSQHPNATAGAVVAIDVTNGEVLVMASAPTFSPGQFVNGISSDVWESMTSEDSGYPFTNRAIAGQYPAASTFKTFTGLAGLQYGIIDTSTVVDCTGVWTGFGDAYPQKCWQKTGHGNVDLETAYSVSCDIYFYEVAKGFYQRRDEDETMLQEYLMTWGFGSKTGIDISGEAAGRIPTPAWKLEYNWDNPEAGQWYPGDYSNLIIGQGDVLVTPLQEAVAFGAVATGKSHVPHLLKEVRNSAGQNAILGKDKLSETQPEYTEGNIDIVRADLRNANVNSAAFQDTVLQAAGKSGTGETGREDKDDYGWYTGYAPYDDPKYCVSCCIEQAGGGTAFCGPVVRYVLAKLLGISEEKIDLVELPEDH